MNKKILFQITLTLTFVSLIDTTHAAFRKRMLAGFANVNPQAATNILVDTGDTVKTAEDIGVGHLFIPRVETQIDESTTVTPEKTGAWDKRGLDITAIISGILQDYDPVTGAPISSVGHDPELSSELGEKALLRSVRKKKQQRELEASYSPGMSSSTPTGLTSSSLGATAWDNFVINGIAIEYFIHYLETQQHIAKPAIWATLKKYGVSEPYFIQGLADMMHQPFDEAQVKTEAATYGFTDATEYATAIAAIRAQAPRFYTVRFGDGEIANRLGMGPRGKGGSLETPGETPATPKGRSLPSLPPTSSAARALNLDSSSSSDSDDDTSTTTTMTTTMTTNRPRASSFGGSGGGSSRTNVSTPTTPRSLAATVMGNAGTPPPVIVSATASTSSLPALTPTRKPSSSSSPSDGSSASQHSGAIIAPPVMRPVQGSRWETVKATVSPYDFIRDLERDGIQKPLWEKAYLAGMTPADFVEGVDEEAGGMGSIRDLWDRTRAYGMEPELFVVGIQSIRRFANLNLWVALRKIGIPRDAFISGILISFIESDYYRDVWERADTRGIHGRNLIELFITHFGKGINTWNNAYYFGMPGYEFVQGIIDFIEKYRTRGVHELRDLALNNAMSADALMTSLFVMINENIAQRSVGVGNKNLLDLKPATHKGTMKEKIVAAFEPYGLDQQTIETWVDAMGASRALSGKILTQTIQLASTVTAGSKAYNQGIVEDTLPVLYGKNKGKAAEAFRGDILQIDLFVKHVSKARHSVSASGDHAESV